MTENVPLFEIAWDGDDIKNAVDSITRGGFWANGPYISEFEERLESYLDVEHAVVFNSGTSALIAALKAHGIGEGDEVIVPSFTFISTANAVKIVGAEPVFADIETERYGLDPDAVEDNITDRTEGMIPVHYSGAPCYIDDLCTLADEHDIAVIEDAAEAFGTKAGDAFAGTIGDAGILSFCQNKVITTGEGGAILTDDDDVAARTELVRSHGRASSGYFDNADGGDYVSLGQNYRMPDVVAAIGVAQMEKATEIIERRRTVAHRYTERIADIDHVSPPPRIDDGRHVYQLYTVTFDTDVDRAAVIESLTDAGISSKVYFDPAHLSTYYRDEHGYERGLLPVTEEISNRVLSLPMSPDMPIETSERVVDALRVAVADAT